ncbi:DUF2187 domain-containing protein [Bombilactobacillus bombi]|uniref:DUF2187 domain-containing protein n=1 Tax=Bombilactobacillus bombi TaxID=1303590 RepID=UPI0015E5CF0F|nr:DUF2187 domain-containing protein [Bombilactobacillus bombi]MBA1433991.1 DUF2187 domain-containing protein [Bombilactobacillus bombi]
MKISAINVGDKLQGKVQEDMEHPFTGTVEKIYSNSALLTIDSYDPKDADNVAELNNKIVVNAQSLKKAK